MTYTLDPQIQVMLDRAAQLNLPKLHDLSAREARAQFDTNVQRFRDTVPPTEIARVETTSTGAGYGHVPVRIYDPQPGKVTPAIVYYHGGGHVLGGLHSHDGVVRNLAHLTGYKVVNVDYRMGPEHPFPAAVEDSFDALRWVSEQAATLNIDPSRIAVAGDSAGGNLATVAALMARDADGPQLKGQLLVYPVIDYRGGTASFSTFASGYGPLEAETVHWFMRHYLPNETDRTDWRAAPKYASLGGLPEACVILAECDVLHDEGRDYAQALSAAGVPTEMHTYSGVIHAFFNYAGLVDQSSAAQAQAAEFLKRVLG